MIHRVTDPRTGAEVARVSQYGVNLDLDARRPARWPDDVRAKAEALLLTQRDAIAKLVGDFPEPAPGGASRQNYRLLGGGAAVLG